MSEEEEEELDEEGKPKPPPEEPVFNSQEALGKFDAKEENAVVPIPKEIIDDVDGDWPMTSEEEFDFINRVLDERG